MKKIIKNIDNCKYAIRTVVIAYSITMFMLVLKVGAAAAFVEMIAAIIFVSLLCCLYNRYVDKYNRLRERKDRATAEKIARARLNIGPKNKVLVRQQKGGGIKLFYKVTL